MNGALTRIAGFFGTLLLLSVVTGILLSNTLPSDPAARRPALIGATALCVALAYVLGYKPGILVRWLLKDSEPTQR